MNVLLIGSGGREHALAWALSASPLIGTLFCAPGNPGIAEVAQCVALDVLDHAAVIGFCQRNDIGFVMVGPEAPLVAGLVDDLTAAGIKAFGPTKAAAQLEGSKGFTKDFCAEFGIPTAAYKRCRSREEALAYLKTQGVPIVVKADGLAAGKGVTVAETREEAIAAVEACFAGNFGVAGAEVVIEECLVGEEASFFALVDGTHALAFGAAQDHKRVGDGEKGPNTGGMGAYSPAPVMTHEMITRTMREIVDPTVAGMQKRGTPFKGVLFAGLMITADGPKLIEFNVRFGDPETQVLIMRLTSDLVDLMLAAAKGDLRDRTADFSPETALTVVMATKGYPGPVAKGSRIEGVERAMAMPGVAVFHAGTAMKDGVLVASGGRVLAVTAIGPTVAEAQVRAYAAVDAIAWPEGFCRRDIGWRAVKG